jgi:hypothetical protein
MASIGPELAATPSVNVNNGTYRNDAAYGIEKKIQVEMTYIVHSTGKVSRLIGVLRQ